MCKAHLAVQVAPGVFSSERLVSFHVAGEKYCLIVDEADVVNGQLSVYILGQNENNYMVSLPRETFTSGTSVVIPKNQISV
jgi:hypothetical protein